MSEFVDEVLGNIENAIILTPRSIAQSWLYEPELGKYVYRVNWTRDNGYTIHRRPHHVEADLDRLWDRNGAMENWVETDGGSFRRAYEARPIIKLQSIAKAHEIIKADVKKTITKPS